MNKLNTFSFIMLIASMNYNGIHAGQNKEFVCCGITTSTILFATDIVLAGLTASSVITPNAGGIIGIIILGSSSAAIGIPSFYKCYENSKIINDTERRNANVINRNHRRSQPDNDSILSSSTGSVTHIQPRPY